MRVGLIGYGAIGQSLLELLSQDCADVDVVAVLVRPGRAQGIKQTLPKNCIFVESLQALLNQSPDVVVECAGQQAVHDYGVGVLESGKNLVIISVGILADDIVREKLLASATKTAAKIFLPAGAIAGIDGLAALKLGGLNAVQYISAKPPSAWLNTPAEEAVDLASLTSRTVIFEGSARDAALQYPKNANIAAIVAMAGIGFDSTRVLLVADPAINENLGCIEAEGFAGSLTVHMDGKAAPENEKTSLSTAYSVARTLRNMVDTVVI